MREGTSQPVKKVISNAAANRLAKEITSMATEIHNTQERHLVACKLIFNVINSEEKSILSSENLLKILDASKKELKSIINLCGNVMSGDEFFKMTDLFLRAKLRSELLGKPCEEQRDKLITCFRGNTTATVVVTAEAKNFHFTKELQENLLEDFFKDFLKDVIEKLNNVRALDVKSLESVRDRTPRLSIGGNTRKRKISENVQADINETLGALFLKNNASEWKESLSVLLFGVLYNNFKFLIEDKFENKAYLNTLPQFVRAHAYSIKEELDVLLNKKFARTKQEREKEILKTIAGYIILRIYNPIFSTYFTTTKYFKTEIQKFSKEFYQKYHSFFPKDSLVDKDEFFIRLNNLFDFSLKKISIALQYFANDVFGKPGHERKVKNDEFKDWFELLSTKFSIPKEIRRPGREKVKEKSNQEKKQPRKKQRERKTKSQQKAEGQYNPILKFCQDLITDKKMQLKEESEILCENAELRKSILAYEIPDNLITSIKQAVKESSLISAHVKQSMLSGKGASKDSVDEGSSAKVTAASEQVTLN